MKWKVLTAIGALLTVGGLVTVGLAFVYYVNRVPVGASVSIHEMGFYLPWFTAPGILAAAAGLILLTFARRF